MVHRGTTIRRTVPRRGTGVAFVIVMAVLVVLSIIGLGVKFLTQGATRVAERGLAGEQAVSVGRMALDEAWLRLDQLVNDPTSGVGQRFRQRLPNVGTSSAFGLTLEPEQTRTIVGAIPDVTITVSKVELVVERQFPIWQLNELETTGFVRASATVEVVRPGIGATVRRVFRQWRSFKTVFPSPPRPLSSYTLFVLCPKHIEAIERQHRALQICVDEAFRRTEKEIEDKYHRSKHLTRPFESNTNPYKAYPYHKYPAFPYNARYTAAVPDQYGAFMAANHDPFGGPINLDPLKHVFEWDKTDMDNYLVSKMRRICGRDLVLVWPKPSDDPSDDPYLQSLQTQLAGIQSSAGSTVTTIDDATAAQLSEQIDNLKNSDKLQRFEKGIIMAMRDYVLRFGFLTEPTIQDFNRRFLAPYLSADLDGKVWVEESMKGVMAFRCTHVFPTEDALYTEIGPKGGEVFLDGIYFVEAPVTIDFTYRGRGTIMGRNRMTVQKCRRAVADDTTSLCTLLSFCNPDGTTTWQSIDLKADVDAGLVALPGLIRGLDTYAVNGSVAVGLLDEATLQPGASGSGSNLRIVRDPRLLYVHPTKGVVKYDRCRVVFGPTPLGTKVERDG